MQYQKTTAALLSITFATVLFLPSFAHAAVSDWIRGASIVPMSTTDLSSENAQQSLRDLAATGATHVSFVVPYYQSNQWATDVQRGWNTPTDESLGAAIDHAHSLGLSVILKMHVEPYDGAWRAHINPEDRGAWFSAYGAAVVHTATIGEAHGAEMLQIGSELVSMAASSMNSTNTGYWQTLIGQVRDVYGGDLVYGANSNSNDNDPFNNEKRFIEFWDSLDYVGIHPYVGLNSDDSVEGMKSAWDFWNNDGIGAFAQSVGKPVIITEVGYRSLDNARLDPWNWSRGGSIDLQEQANAYDALMGYWNDYPYMQGVIFWEWSTNPNAGGNDTAYTPQNKPAEEVMSRWFGNPVAPTPTTTPATTTPPVVEPPATTTPTTTPPVPTTPPATTTPTTTPEQPSEPTEPTPTEPTPTEEEPTTGRNDRARMDRPERTVRGGEHLDFVGREFGREENINVMLNGTRVRGAYADGGGNFSTGSIIAPHEPGVYTYEFVGERSNTTQQVIVTVTE